MRQALTKQMLAVVLLLVSLPACSSGPNWVEIELRVHDHHDKPVPGAQVRGRFYVDQQLEDTDRESHTAVTDKQGRAQIAGKEYRHVPITVEKTGYYTTKRDVVVTQKKRHSIDVLLRGKRNPIPLFAKKFRGTIPEKGERIGFNMKSGDWVAPYGSGDTAHVYFKYVGWVEGPDNYNIKLKIIMPRPGDGMARVSFEKGANSKLRLPYEAPKNGYKKKEVLFQKEIKEEGVERTNNIRRRDGGSGYFLRVRSEVNSKGSVTKANFAKINGAIDYSGNEKGPTRIEFKYYYNPKPNDRNLEFAIGENLFDDLPEEAQVHEP